MSSGHPLRERLQSNSPDPELARPTTPLRINKHTSPQARQGLSPPPQPQLQPAAVPVARRSSSSFKHVRENKLVSKSPFRMMRPSSQMVPGSPTRRVSGEKRARPDSMHAQAENEKPLGFKRRQSRAFQVLSQKEPVTKSPFRRPVEPADDPLPPVPPPKIRPKSALPPSYIPVPSPMRGVLSNSRRMHGPRVAGERQHHRRKTVTFDDHCDVLEFEREEVVLADVSYDENGYGYGFSYEDEGEGEGDEDAAMEDGFEDDIDQLGNDSLTGMVDSMLQAALPHTPPRHEDEEDADLLPPSPSPAKPPRDSPPQRPSPEPVHEGSSTGSPLPHAEHSHSQLKDEEAPFEESFRSVRSDDSLDPSNLSIGHSEVSLNNLDSHSLLADIKLDDGDVLTGASFAPVANSSPRTRSRSGTPLDRSFDRSLEARSTPVLTPSRLTSPRSGSSSPFPRQIFKQASASSLGSLTGGGRRSPITREAIQERLLRRKSEDALSTSRSATGSPVPPHPADHVEQGHNGQAEETDPDTSRMTELVEEEPEPALPPMTRHNPTHDGVMSIDPNPQPIDPPRPTLQERAQSMDGGRPPMDAKAAFAGLDLDFEHGFALGEEGMSVSAGLGTGMTARARHSSMHLGDVSALDKLMEDMAHGAGVDVNTSLGNVSLVSEGQSYASLRVEAVTEGVKAATFALPDIERDDEGMGIDLDLDPSVHLGDAQVPTRGIEPAPPASSSPPPPPPPAKDAIRAREELIKAKKREARQREEELFDGDMGSGSAAPAALSVPARPARRRSLSTGDAEPPRAQRRAATTTGSSSRDDSDDLLDLTPLRGEDAPLADTINRELRKREGRTRSKYHVREHTETIYASSDAKMNADNGKPWRTIRRPSDMNEHAKQLRELREQQKAGKAHGKVFVKVVGLRGLQVPIPEQPTKITCTLNNGIHFVTTPEAPLARDCSIDQEFELIEHSKLEFTLTIKVKRDPHIVAQFKALQAPPPPRPPPQPLPPPASKGGGSRSGMRSFLFGSPKKGKAPMRGGSPAPPPPPPPEPPSGPPHRLPENLARYLKPDGTLGRAFIAFKDIAILCDTRLLETSFPLIGQRLEEGGTMKAMQIGEIVLQLFRLPPLPGITPEKLPQSLEECHRGLTHTRWHKACYIQGMLTQLGGDCTTWRRRHFRLIGSSLVAYNDVTKRAIATIDLRKAISIHDEQNDVRSPASAATARTDYDDSEPYGLGGINHSFKLEFEADQITFYADTDQEKANWVNILKALIGRIPPNPLWAEVLFQRQEQAKATANTESSR